MEGEVGARVCVGGGVCRVFFFARRCYASVFVKRQVLFCATHKGEVEITFDPQNDAKGRLYRRLQGRKVGKGRLRRRVKSNESKAYDMPGDKPMQIQSSAPYPAVLAKNPAPLPHNPMKLDPLTSKLHGSPLNAGGIPSKRKSLSHARQLALPFWVRAKGMGKLSSFAGSHIAGHHARARAKTMELVLPGGHTGRRVPQAVGYVKGRNTEAIIEAKQNWSRKRTTKNHRHSLRIQRKCL